MSKVPETLGACEQLLVMVKLELKPLLRQRSVLQHRIATLRGQGASAPLPERRARRGERSPPKEGETE